LPAIFPLLPADFPVLPVQGHFLPVHGSFLPVRGSFLPVIWSDCPLRIGPNPYIFIVACSAVFSQLSPQRGKLENLQAKVTHVQKKSDPVQAKVGK
jgi:hypothetical protein